jgi:ATP-dependent DNA helicase MPH1
VIKLVQKEILNERDLDVWKLKPFRLTMRRQEIMRDPSMKWAIGMITQLEKMSRAMGSLVSGFMVVLARLTRNKLEFSIGMFHTSLMEISGGSTAASKKSGAKGGANSLRNNFEFQKLQRDVEAEINCIRIGQGGKTKADKHPKMVKTLELVCICVCQVQVG